MACDRAMTGVAGKRFVLAPGMPVCRPASAAFGEAGTHGIDHKISPFSIPNGRFAACIGAKISNSIALAFDSTPVTPIATHFPCRHKKLVAAERLLTCHVIAAATLASRMI